MASVARTLIDDIGEFIQKSVTRRLHSTHGEYLRGKGRTDGQLSPH